MECLQAKRSRADDNESERMNRSEAECLEAELSAAEDREMEQSGKFEAMRSEGEDIER